MSASPDMELPYKKRVIDLGWCFTEKLNTT